MFKFVPGSRILGTVTHVDFDAGLCLGYCQLCEQSVVDELAEAIQINVKNGKVTENSWSEDEIVLALFHEDSNWYRGRVVGKGANGLSIFFVDYGNTETVSAEDIRKLPSLLKHIEPLATKCIFVELTPARGQWTPEEEQGVKDKVFSEEFIVEVVNKSQSGLSVKLHSPSATTSVSTISLRMQNVDLNSSHQCYISYIESANKFWVQLKEEENELNDLMSQIADHCSTGAETLGNPQMGAYCLTFYSEDKAPYRSQILTSTSGKCLVQFVDFGNSESKSQSDLMKLPSEFVDFPVQGIRCCYKTTKINPSKLEDMLQEVSDSDEGVKVKFLRKSNDEYVVQIDEIETMEGSTGLNSSQTGESQHEYPIMSLTANQTCDVCICYVEHPGHFFAQLLSSSDTVNELMDMAEEEFITNKPISKPALRLSCLAKMSDGSVYRSSVESTGTSVRVTSVDFGFTETVDPQNLREISEKLMSIPAQCVQCTVDLTKMSSNHWSEGEIKLLQGFENNVPLVSMVTSTRGGVYQLDLYDTRDKDIDRYLNEELLGVKKQGKTVSSYKESARRPLVVRRIQIPQPDIIVGSTEVVCVTAVHSPNQFYGQLTKIPIDKFASLQETLMKVYEMGQDVVVDGEVGTFCCAKYTDGSWYRALITAVTGSSAEVMFIDFGDSCTVPLTSLYQIHPSIADTPQLCIMCQFQKQPVNVSLSDLQTLLVDKVVEVKLVTKTDGIFPTFQVELTNHSKNRNITTKLFGNQHKIPRLPQVAYQSGNAGEKKGMVGIGDMEEIMVTHVVDPEHFHCQLSKTATQLDALMDSLDKHYSVLAEEEEQLLNVTLGQHCVAKYSADQDWYRAQITGMLNNGMVELRYIDYGNTECSAKENLKQISDELMTLPPQAIYCGLEGVVSTTGFWLPEKVVQFEDLVLDKTFKATFKSRKAGEDLLLCVLESETGTSINRMYDANTSPVQTATNNTNNNCFQQRGQFGDRSSGGRYDNSKPSFHGGSEGRPSFGGRNQSGFSSSAGGNSGFGKSSEGDGWDETPSTGSSGFGGGGRGGFGGSGGSSFGGGGGRFGGSSRGGGEFGGSSRGGGRFGGSDGGGRGCRKCGEEGHFARDCPQGGSSGGGGRTCHRCGQEGHFIRDCPQADSGGGRDRGCRKCGEEGHFARDCPKGGGSGRGCHKCGEEGHFARDCTSTNQRSDRGFGGRGGSFGGRGGLSGSRGGFGGKSERTSSGFGGSFSTTSVDEDWGDSPSDDKTKSMSAAFGSRSDRKPSSGFQTKSSGKDFGTSKEDDWDDVASTGTDKSPGWSATPKTKGGSEWEHTDNNVYRHARLPSDKTVKVYVVYIKSPTEFWCQTISKSEELEEMMEKMNEEYGSLFPKERCIHEYEIGTPCIAKFSDDDRWYRGEISKVEDDKVGVLFVDYGNTETVEKSALKAANANYMSLEVQGVKCSLNGVVKEDWSTEAVGKFEEMVMDKELQATVVNFSGGLYLLKLTENGEDVAQSLADAGLCKMLSAPTVTKLAENPYSKLPQQEGSNVSAFVSWIENPHNFWIQPKEMSEKLEQLVAEIQEHYEAGGSKVDSVNPGDPVVTKFTEDDAWYRAYVENIEGSDVTVRFVDYGNTDTITKDMVFQVAENFRKVPGQSLRCSLMGVKPLQNGWSEDAKEIMHSLIPETVNVNFVGGNPDGTWVVSLSVGEVDVAEELIGAAVARKAISTVSDSSTSVVALDFPPQAALPVGSSHQVFVSHVHSPTSFYCQLAQKSDQLDELMGKIEEQVASFTPVSSLTEGMTCMAKYSSDEAWYRSLVTHVAENKADILFVDYGNSESSSKENICNIPPELLQIEPQAIHCKLSNTNGVGDDLEDQLADKEMTLTVVHHSPTCLTVDLFFDDGKPLTEAGSVVQENSPQEPPMYQHTSYAEPAGTQFRGYATYIKSPDKLYLQKEGCEGLLETMTANLQQKMGGSSVLANPKSGQICGTVFSEDKAWYRGVIEEIDAGKARVRFIDYGNSEEVETNSLKILPSELASIPPFAYSCSLHGVSPLEGDWSSEVTTQLEALIVDKDLTCTFMTGSEVKLEVESKDVGQSLKDAGLAKYEESSNIPVLPVKVTSIEEQAVPTEQTTAYVSNCDKDVFYLQLSSQEEELGEIIEKVQIHCGNSSPLGDIAVNNYCCAKFTTDDSWYRARVKNTTGEMVDVLFIDFGNSDTVSKDNLRCLGITTSALAYPCCLTGCTTMSTRQLERFSELTTDAEVMVTFDKQTADRNEVTLVIADDQNVNKEIMQLGESEPELTSHSAEEMLDKDSQSVLMEESHITLDKTGFSETDLNVTTNGAGDLSEEEDTISSLNDLKVAEVSAGDRVEVSVSCVYSPSCFYIHQGSMTPLNDLMDQMYEFYSNTSSGAYRLESVEINTPCAAKFSEDASWYRCVIKKQVDMDKVEVIFLDHGNMEVCDIADLRRLLWRFCELPLQTVECSLAGVMSKDGPWSEDAVILFNNLTLDKTLLADVVSLGDDNSCIVQLLHLGLSLSDRLIEEGHGTQATTPVTVSRKVKRVFSDSSDVATPSLKLSEECPAVIEEEGTLLYGRFKPVPVETDTEYIVTISHSENSGNFWCHLVDNVTTLGDMMDEMLEEFSPSNKEVTSHQNDDISQLSENGDEELSVQKGGNSCEKTLGKKLEKFEPGTTCCVHFPVDGQYYRSVIQEEAPGRDSVKVFYVDFGNLETVTKCNVYQLPDKFSGMAAQALNCQLAGLASMLWSTTSNEKFTEMTEDKELLMYVVEKMEKELNIVDLFDGDTSISSCLTGRENGDQVTDEDQSIDLVSLFSPYSCTLLSLDMEYDITVTAVESPLRFCVRLKNCNEVKIQEEITKYVEGDLQKLVDIKEGDACLVLSPKENQYQRVKCLKIINEEQVQVLFVDSGKKEVIKMDGVFSIPDFLVQIPAQVSVCALTDILSSTGTWSKEARLFFSDRIQDVSVMYVRHMTAAGLYKVSVECEGQELNRLMVDLGYAGAEPDTTLFEQMMEGSDIQETSFNKLTLERENSFGSEGEGGDENVVKSLNLDSSLETTDASICMCHDSTLDTTGASDSFHYINVKKDEDVKDDDEFFDAVDEGKQQSETPTQITLNESRPPDTPQRADTDPPQRADTDPPQRANTEDGNQSEMECQVEPVENKTDEEKVDYNLERTEEEGQPPADSERNKGETTEENECRDEAVQKENEVAVNENSKGFAGKLDESEEVDDGEKTGKVVGVESEIEKNSFLEIDNSVDIRCEEDLQPDISSDVRCKEDLRPSNSSDVGYEENSGPDNSSDVKCEENSQPGNSSDVKCEEDTQPDNSSNVRCKEDSQPDNSVDVKCEEDSRPDNSTDIKCEEDQSALDVKDKRHSEEGEEFGRVVEVRSDMQETDSLQGSSGKDSVQQSSVKQEEEKEYGSNVKNDKQLKSNEEMDVGDVKDSEVTSEGICLENHADSNVEKGE